ncbi:hypothetical protein JOB18_000335 [Solea senegalensis]|uniref:Uncharacterized protein n=1 Tax=Solea senegalensis TaxID=28829 RepID=A0AAV6PG57_SOLSE|nr:hypothetical protein JOB18_000335 [Solea senegalensis]
MTVRVTEHSNTISLESLRVHLKMSKVERLGARLEKLLCKAVHEVLEVVKETVSEYQEKTARTQRENQSLKRRLQELQSHISLRSNETEQQSSLREKEEDLSDTELHPVGLCEASITSAAAAEHVHAYRMSKLERLNARVAQLLTEAVQEVLEVVKETVSEYQEKTARTQRENETLKKRLMELQGKMTKESTRCVVFHCPFVATALLLISIPEE